jgi:hypothetical protein
VAVAFFLKQAVPRALSEVLRELDNLDELSQSIEEVTDAFSMHYRMAAAIPTEVKSQIDALKKARGGLGKAQEIASRVTALLEIYPEDKTAQRAVKDAAVMVKRFARHEKDAAKMIRTLSKKALPEDLKKMAASVQRSIKRKLEDPKALQVLPWTVEQRSYATDRSGAVFQVVFRIEDKSLPNNKAETILQVNTVDPVGVELGGGYSKPKATSVKVALAHFLAQLQGYAGLAGEEDRTTNRMDAAQSIANALKSWGRKVGEGDRDAEIGKGGLSVSYSIRRDTRWESHSDSDYEYGVGEEEETLLTALKPYLKPYQQDIKSATVGYDEKGWWSAWVQLK